MEIHPDKTVSFSGHRSFKIAGTHATLFNTGTYDADTITSRVEDELCRLCMSGYDTFLCGMAEGFDLAAAEAVTRTRIRFPDIRLIAVVPHPDQAKSFGKAIREKYTILIGMADGVVTTSMRYSPDCFHRRNDFLLQNSSVLVCYYNGSKGGTAYTVKQAIKRSMRVINIFNNA